MAAEQEDGLPIAVEHEVENAAARRDAGHVERDLRDRAAWKAAQPQPVGVDLDIGHVRQVDRLRHVDDCLFQAGVAPRIGTPQGRHSPFRDIGPG
jgi:hypothetical protein